MEDHSHTDLPLQQHMDEHQQQQQRQAIHPAPSPVPYSPRFPAQSRNESFNIMRRHHSARQVSDTLRRRSVQQQQQSAEEASVSSDVDASFRLSYSGLDMPSSADPMENPNGNYAYGNSTTNNDHLLPHNYYHTNAGLHHNASPTVYGSSNAHHRLHQSLNNVASNAYSPEKQISPIRQRQHSLRKEDSPRLQRAHTHSHAHTTHNDDDGASVGTESSRRRRSSFTPQHQLDRRNSRRRVTQSNASTSAVPNRYYLAGKSIQTEWSSPTRQRRSRSTLNNQSQSGNSRGRPKSRPSLADRDNHDNPTNQHGNHIIVLPSISIPNGNHDDYRLNSHPSQIKPPTFPQRKACVHATSMFCTLGAFKWCVIIQIILVIPMCLYVFDAHAQKKHAKQQLQQYNEEHEHILNQMMWMDQAAKKIKAHHHKHNSRQKFYFQPDDPNNEESNPLDLEFARNNNNNEPNNFFESYYSDNSATEDLRDSVHKLRGQMRDMQYRIQQNSKARITEKYGEGPIRVYIHPEPEDPILAAAAAGPEGTPQEMTSEISLELFIEDTPHAVSTFLYQIERGHWNRVQMNWKSDTSILSKPGSSVTSGMGDWMQTSRLEFLEQFPIRHCEVALVQQGQMGVLSLQINLVEVPFQEQEEVCIGRLLNDRLILPKARGYFMAEFTTSSNSNTNDNTMQGQHLLPKENRLSLHQRPPLKELMPHEPPPPVIEAGNVFLVEEENEKVEVPQRRQRLRGRAAIHAQSNEEANVGLQLVPPLEEPADAQQANAL